LEHPLDGYIFVHFARRALAVVICSGNDNQKKKVGTYSIGGTDFWCCPRKGYPVAGYSTTSMYMPLLNDVTALMRQILAT
jgi:hypothetical protein